MGFAYADYDNDGWVDFVVGNWNEGYRLFHNTSHENANWLTVDLTGGGPVNRDAIGTRVTVTTTDGRVQMQTVTAGGSLGAGHDMRLHFGLGSAEISAVDVVWPNGETTVFNDVEANQLWHVRYEEQEAKGADGIDVMAVRRIISVLIGIFTSLFG